MKSTSAYRVIRLLPVIVILTACSSVDEKTIETVQNNQVIPKGHPNAINVKHLLTQSNRYLEHKKIISAATRNDFSLALNTKKAGQLDEAEKTFIDLTVREPSLSGPWVQLGDIAKERAQHALTIQQREQLLKKAAAQYHQALSINSHNYHGHNRLATVYRQQGRFDLALVHYQKAIDSWPAFATAYKNRGILYDLYIGDKAKALNNYQHYQALISANANAESNVTQNKEYVKQQRQVKGWIADLTRQIQQQSRLDRQQPTEVVNNAL
jgi:tetratricopeptide (TPR) repeat protein